jgi:type IV pilus assembly protein PilM
MIGIDISDRSVKVVQLSGKKELQAHCWHAVPPQAIAKGIIQDTKSVAEVVRRALTACRLGNVIQDVVVASIPEIQSFLRVVEIPVMVKEEISEAVQWEVAKNIPFGLENVYIDWQPLHDGHAANVGRMEVLVGAAQKKVVDPLYEVLRSLDLDVAACELESQAIVRSLMSQELRHRPGLLIIDLGASATNVIIHDHGAMRFTASLDKGTDNMMSVLPASDVKMLSGAPHEVHLQHIDSVASALRPVEEELAAEVRGIIDFYISSTTKHVLHEILLTGGGANLPGLDQAFLRFFDNVHIQRGNPWANILPPGKNVRPPLNLQESVLFSTALGLALRPALR